MTDVFSVEKRHDIMSKIKGKDTKIEIKVRKWLYKNGVRYRKHSKKIIGRPDISIKKYKIAIFINGCFWHGHEDCKLYTVPKTRTEFWREKIEKNKARDKKNCDELQKEGWTVINLWECEIEKRFDEVMDGLLEKIITQTLT